MWALGNVGIEATACAHSADMIGYDTIDVHGNLHLFNRSMQKAYKAAQRLRDVTARPADHAYWNRVKQRIMGSS